MSRRYIITGILIGGLLGFIGLETAQDAIYQSLKYRQEQWVLKAQGPRDSMFHERLSLCQQAAFYEWLSAQGQLTLQTTIFMAYLAGSLGLVVDTAAKRNYFRRSWNQFLNWWFQNEAGHRTESDQK